MSSKKEDQKFNIEDLDTQDVNGETRYIFPGSSMARTRESAENVLKIANYTGKLTDGIDALCFITLIEDVQALKARVDNLEDHE